MNQEIYFDIHPEALTEIRDSALYNADLALIKNEERNWKTMDIAHLWVGACPYVSPPTCLPAV